MDDAKLMLRNGTVPNPVSMGRSWPPRGLLRKIVLTVVATVIAGCGGGSGTSSGGPAAYTVAVTVNGLSGSGLVLALNGTDHLAFTASTTLAFTTSLPLGSAYQVVVQSQPSSPAQLCTVTNASGTIRPSTNVYVACVDSGNTVGLTVSGLSGSGLGLQLNGGNYLPIAANGSNTFAETVDPGMAYAVTVLTQPFLPAQTCAVTNGSGVMGAANVTNVVVICVSAPDAGGGPGQVEMAYGVVADGNAVVGYPAASSGSVNPTVVIVPNGQSFCAVATDASGYVYVASCTQGNSSSAEVLVFAPTATGFATPVRTLTVSGGIGGLAVDGPGNIYVSTGTSSTSNEIFEFAAGANGNVAPVRTIAIDISGSQLAVDGQGNIFSWNPEGYGSISMFTPGQSGNAMPARTIPLTEEIIGVGLDPSGNIYVAMAVEKPGPVSIVEFQGGVAGSGSPINTISGSAPPGNQDASGVSLDAAGNLYVLEGETLLRFAAGVNGFGSPTSETWVLENANVPDIANFTVN